MTNVDDRSTCLTRSSSHDQDNHAADDLGRHVNQSQLDYPDQKHLNESASGGGDSVVAGSDGLRHKVTGSAVCRKLQEVAQREKELAW